MPVLPLPPHSTAVGSEARAGPACAGCRRDRWTDTEAMWCTMDVAESVLLVVLRVCGCASAGAVAAEILGASLAPRDSADCRLLARRHPSVWRTQLACRAGWLLLTSVLLLRSPPLLIARPLPLHIDPCAHSSPPGHTSREKSLGFAGRGLLREQRG